MADPRGGGCWGCNPPLFDYFTSTKNLTRQVLSTYIKVSCKVILVLLLRETVKSNSIVSVKISNLRLVEPMESINYTKATYSCHFMLLRNRHTFMHNILYRRYNTVYGLCYMFPLQLRISHVEVPVQPTPQTAFSSLFGPLTICQVNIQYFSGNVQHTSLYDASRSTA